MRRYVLLLKKQLLDVFPMRNNVARKKNILGVLLVAVLTAGIMAAFIAIFSRFTSAYLQIKINRVPDIAARQYELMSMTYFVLIIAFILTGTNKLCYTLFENSDIRILITMPFSSLQIFAAKLTWLYIKQAATALVCVLTLNLTFFITAGIVSAYGIIMSIIISLLLPVIPLAVSSVIALPYYFVKQTVKSHYLLSFAVMTLLLAAFCVLYAYTFELAGSILDTGKLATLFNEDTMTKIASFTQNNYPANLFAGIMLQREAGKNFGILLAFAAGAAAIGIPVVHAMFVRVTQYGLTPHIPHVKRNKPIFIQRNRLASLLAKEFVSVLRTPAYSYMYFATAVVMPVMAYYSAKLSTGLLTGLLGEAGFDFELCTFIVILYGTLTNTFCSTNISRDGYMAMVQKTLPYSPAQILSAKMLFSGIVSEIGIAAACITFAASGLEGAGNAAITFIAASLLSTAQIFFATKLDLLHPHFSRNEDGEIKESNSTVSAIILVGLAVCFAMGVLLLFNTLHGISSANTVYKALSYVYSLIIPAALLGAAAAFFFAKLNIAYANLDEEGNNK